MVVTSDIYWLLFHLVLFQTKEYLADPSKFAAAVTTSAPAAASVAVKKEEKKPEPESESDEDMGFGLFD